MSEQPEYTEDPYPEQDPDEVRTAPVPVAEPEAEEPAAEAEPEEPAAAEDEPEPVVVQETETLDPAEAPAEKRMGRVINAPAVPNNGGYENRVVPPAKVINDKTAGANATMAANTFEQRVTQEQGTH